MLGDGGAPGPTQSWAGGLSSLGGSSLTPLASGQKWATGDQGPSLKVSPRQLTQRDVCSPSHPGSRWATEGHVLGGRGWHQRLGPEVEAWLWWQERQEQVVGAMTGGQTLPDLGTRDAPSYYLMEAARSGGVESPRFCFCVFFNPKKHVQSSRAIALVNCSFFLFPLCLLRATWTPVPGERAWCWGPRRGLSGCLVMLTGAWRPSVLCFSGKHSSEHCVISPP